MRPVSATSTAAAAIAPTSSTRSILGRAIAHPDEAPLILRFEWLTQLRGEFYNLTNTLNDGRIFQAGVDSFVSG